MDKWTEIEKDITCCPIPGGQNSLKDFKFPEGAPGGRGAEAAMRLPSEAPAAGRRWLSRRKVEWQANDPDRKTESVNVVLLLLLFGETAPVLLNYKTCFVFYVFNE